MVRQRRGARAARRALSVIGGTVAVVMLATVAPADASVTIDEFGINPTNSSPGGITVGPDGNVWFTEVQGGGTDGLGSLTAVRSGTPVSGLDYPGTKGDRLGNVTTGPDGNLWFTVQASPYDKIGRLTPAGYSYSVKLWTLDDPNNGVPPDIVLGPDGNLWFTENSVMQIGRITPTGVITTFSAGPCPNNVAAQPLDIAAGPDKNLWYTVSSLHCDKIGQITPSGASTMWALPAEPVDVAAGPDGNMWWTSNSGVGNINPTTHSVSVFNNQAAAGSIAPSPCAKDLWFTSGPSDVGQITTTGMETLFSLPTPNSDPQDITAAPNGTVFLTEPNGGAGKIARAVDSSSLLPCVMLLDNTHFAVPVVYNPQGGTVQWQILPPGAHGVADASGMQLFGFSPASGLPTPVPIGSFTSFQFNWAGTFPYDDPFHPAAKGRVNVPITVTPVAGTPSQANVTWAVADAPAGSGFDVQLKPPGSTAWVTWQSGVTSLSAPFGPTDPLWAGPGTYAFRARLRQLSSNAASGYSAAKSITLS